ILVVLTIIVLVMALAVPAFNVLTGSNSLAAAENRVSAMLGVARARALAEQREMGLFFYLNPSDQRVAMVLVEAGFDDAGVRHIRLAPAGQPELLPSGVGMQFLESAQLNGATRQSDGYVGFGVDGVAHVGRVILLDQAGRVLPAERVD